MGLTKDPESEFSFNSSLVYVLRNEFELSPYIVSDF